MNLGEKSEFPDLEDFTKSRLTKNILYQKETPSFSIKISRGIPNIKSDYGSSTKYPEFLIMGRRYVNRSLSQLYKRAFGFYKFVSELDSIGQNQFDPPLESLNEDNTYCVELIGELNSWADFNDVLKEANQLLQVGLEETFGITAVKENRFVKSYILKEFPGNDKFKANTGGDELWDKTAFYLHIENLPSDKAFRAITSKLTWRADIDYVTNELDYKGNISLNVTASTYNYQSLKPALAEYGLDLSIGERDREVWVIKNTKN